MLVVQYALLRTQIPGSWCALYRQLSSRAVCHIEEVHLGTASDEDHQKRSTSPHLPWHRRNHRCCRNCSQGQRGNSSESRKQGYASQARASCKTENSDSVLKSPTRRSKCIRKHQNRNTNPYQENHTHESSICGTSTVFCIVWTISGTSSPAPVVAQQQARNSHPRTAPVPRRYAAQFALWVPVSPSQLKGPAL